VIRQLIRDADWVVAADDAGVAELGDEGGAGQDGGGLPVVNTAEGGF
jgi:hypothetical protein